MKQGLTAKEVDYYMITIKTPNGRKGFLKLKPNTFKKIEKVIGIHNIGNNPDIDRVISKLHSKNEKEKMRA